MVGFEMPSGITLMKLIKTDLCLRMEQTAYQKIYWGVSNEVWNAARHQVEFYVAYIDFICRMVKLEFTNEIN